jgi:hypothetical protein
MMNRRGFLVGSASVPLVSLASPSLALQNPVTFFETGPKWPENMYYMRMLHESFESVEKQRLFMGGLHGTYESAADPRISHMGHDDDYTYIVRFANHQLPSGGSDSVPILPIQMLYVSQLIVHMRDGLVYKDRIGGKSGKNIEMLPFPNMVTV